MRRLIAAGIVALIWTSVPAQAGVKFSLFGDLDSSRYATGGSTFSGKSEAGGGLGVEIPLGASSGLEIDGIYQRRNNQIQASWLQIPVLYRLWLGNVLTLGAGAYYSQGLGSPTVNGATETFAQAGYTQNDAGLVGAVGLSIPVSSFHLLIEGRYDLGIYNVSSIQGASATFNDLQILVGIRLGL